MNPPDYSGVEFPPGERRKLRLLEKTPMILQHEKPKKSYKRLIDMRGPELVHTQLLHKQFGIQALGGAQLRWGHIEMMRLIVNRNMDDRRMFAVWRLDSPWKPITKKGLGHRMGGGKGAISHYVTPIRAGRIVLELGGYCQFEEVEYFLRKAAHNLPCPARAVTHEMLEEEKAKEKELLAANLNPFTFEQAVRDNLLGINKCLSKYDHLWYNKYR